MGKGKEWFKFYGIPLVYVLVSCNEMMKNPKAYTGREGLTMSHGNKCYFSIKFLSFKCIRVDCKYKQKPLVGN